MAKRFKIDFRTSKFLIGSVVVSVLMHLVILYAPLNTTFKECLLG